tara:strand:+ start:8421 stop:8852 length:432 start_codon:yes stop_codon:yes gene_type:complete
MPEPKPKFWGILSMAVNVFLIDRDLVCVVVEGNFGMGQAEQMLRDIAEILPDQEGDFDVLMDGFGLDSEGLGITEMDSLARRVARQPCSSRIRKMALVAGCGKTLGLFKLYTQFADNNGEMQIFRSPGEAKKWILEEVDQPQI